MKLLTRNMPNKNGSSYSIYDITTNLGLSVSVLDLGASIQKIAITPAEGKTVSIALGSPEAAFYENCACYAGATLAPNAGRIRGGLLPVDGRVFPLNRNDGANQLHGGPHSLSDRLWAIDSVTCTSDTATVILSAFQPDGMDGYPGNRNYQARYRLEDTNWLTVEYSARTDKPTYINMSNHTYWNLTGDFTRPATDQKLTLFANNVCINDSSHLPVDIVPVAGTAFDFRSARQIGSDCGYNHAFLLNRNQPFRTLRDIPRQQFLKKAAILSDPASGRTVKMMTDAPALVLYSGAYLADGMELHDGQRSCASCAVALEAQDIPDVMHLLPDSYVLTTPEHPFHRIIRYQIL